MFFAHKKLKKPNGIYNETHGVRPHKVCKRGLTESHTKVSTKEIQKEWSHNWKNEVTQLKKCGHTGYIFG